jgi:hypothetical protein
MADKDHITAIEEHISGVLREDLPKLLPGVFQPDLVCLYGGEFGTDDIIGTLDEMVQRGTHVLVSYMGGSEYQHDNTGLLSEGGARFTIYVAGRNLRDRAEQRRDIYPVIQSTRMIVRMAESRMLTGDLGTATWEAKVSNLWPGEDAIVASVPGVACLKLDVTCDLKVLWDIPDELSNIGSA